jgi:membrane dipeptidase
MRHLCALALPCLLVAAAGLFGQAEDAIARRAQKLHFSAFVIDTHIDTTPKLQQQGWSFAAEHADGHVDLPRMKKGGLDALFFSIYMPGTVTGPKAVQDSLERIAAVHRLAEQMPDQVALATTAAEVRRAHAEHKIVALVGVEGGHMIANSLPVLRMYARLGVRYLTLTHSVNTDWADSSGDQPRHGGLTDFGREVVRECNRLGVMVDISHVSDKTFEDALAASRAPLVASHSSCRAISGHARNMTDAMIRALGAKGGVIHINYADQFLDNKLYEYYKKAEPELRELRRKYSGPESRGRLREELTRRYGPPPSASWEKIVEHIDHAVKLAGVDHVGLGSDFDGATMPDGMEDVTRLPKITEALLRKGYKEEDVRKILGENTLRLLERVEKVASELRAQKAAAAGE